MKKMQLSRKFWTAILLLLCPLAATAKNNPPRYPIQPIGTAPVIDGKLDDACWNQLPAAGTFVDDKAKPSPAQTIVRMGYDDKNLYIAVRVEEPEMDKVKATITQHDGGVWGDDDLEIYLAATGKATPYLVFMLNSIGTTEESSMDASAASFNAPWKCKVNREASAWTAEIAIPFSSLGVGKPKPNAIWYGNICRGRTHANQISSWSKTNGAFHDADSFGEFSFLDKIRLNEVNVTSTPTPDGAKMRLEARGVPAAYETRISATLDGAAQPDVPELDNKFSVSPGQLTGVENTYAHPEAARMILQPQLTDPASGLLFRSEGMVVKEVDELTALIAGLAKSLAEFPPDQAPAAFHDLATTWPSRLETLQKTPDLVSAKALRQEIRAAQWARNLPAENTSQPVLLFPTYSFVDMDYDFLPEASVIEQP